MARPAMDPEVELELLARHKTTPALLRSAWLFLQLDNPRAAIDATAEVLYGPVQPSANDEAFARYLRAEAYQRSGFAERAEWDRQQAATLANDPELRQRLASLTRSTSTVAPAALATELVVQPRSAWSARAVDKSNVNAMQGIRRITIHHSAMYFRDTRPNTCAAQIQKIQREHMSGRGYGDIGYHFLIDPSGRIWEGRDLRYQGAHADGDNNKNNVGICLLGNFMRGRNGQSPSQAQVRAMRLLTATLMAKHNVGPDEIYQHSDFKATDCPGVVMEPIVDQMVRDLNRQGVSAMVEAAGQ
ncbi:MAG: N-acetylmuramoyl-L-alanine amidase [Planctomycetes bacterium]|nr:N-acetylmuramoyl-L-alanine amidase [Planctomycetota bacterium]